MEEARKIAGNKYEREGGTQQASKQARRKDTLGSIQIYCTYFTLVTFRRKFVNIKNIKEKVR